MVHLKRTAINPLNPSGPPIVVIPRLSYRNAPSELRRCVRHDAVERHYGSARQEEADEENERLDQESDEEYGHNLSSDHDEDYEENDECLVVDDGTGQGQVQLDEFSEIAESNMGQGQGQEQPQSHQQPQERPRWARKQKSPAGEIIVVGSSKSPEVEQEEQQQQLSPMHHRRRTKAYKHIRRKVTILEVIVVDSSSDGEENVEMEGVQEAPRQKPKPKLRKKVPANNVVEESYDMEVNKEQTMAKHRKKALVPKAGLIYEEEGDEVRPAPKRKGGWPKGKKRGPPLPILAEFEAEYGTENVEERPNPKSRKKALGSKPGFSYEEAIEEKPTFKARKKAIVSEAVYNHEEGDIYEVPPTLKRRGGWPMGRKRGPSIPNPTVFEAEVEDEVAELQKRAKARAMPRKRLVPKAMVEEADSHEEMIEPQPDTKSKPKLRNEAPRAKTKVESEDETDEPQRKTIPRRNARRSDTPDTIAVDPIFEDEGKLVDESTKRLGYLKLPESEESEEYTTRKPKSRAGASTRGRGGGAAARGRGNLTGKAARTTVSRQTAMLKERGPSILEEEMARHGVKTKREDGELMMR